MGVEQYGVDEDRMRIIGWGDGMRMRMKKMQTLFSLLFAFVCEVGGGRVCAEGGK